MSILDNLLGSAGSGQEAHTGVAGALLGLLAAETGGVGSYSGTADPGRAAPDHPTAVSSGLSELVRRFEQGGLGDVIQSWIGSGSNQAALPEQLHQAIGSETMDRLSAQTGLDHDRLLQLLMQALPTIVDRLTPDQRIPQEHEVAALTSNPPIAI